jgi:hypothetical protein
MQHPLLTGDFSTAPVLRRSGPPRNTTLLRAEPSKTQDRESEPKSEENLIAEQHRLAHDDAARRAREEFEMARQLQIEQARTAAGLCNMCGRKFGIFERLTRRRTHRRCTVFIG